MPRGTTRRTRHGLEHLVPCAERLASFCTITMPRLYSTACKGNGGWEPTYRTHRDCAKVEPLTWRACPLYDHHVHLSCTTIMYDHHAFPHHSSGLLVWFGLVLVGSSYCTERPMQSSRNAIFLYETQAYQGSDDNIAGSSQPIQRSIQCFTSASTPKWSCLFSS